MIRNKTWIFFLLAAITLMSNQQVKGQDGKTIYEKACKACHTIGGGRTIGPDLLGINQKREKEWLISFIKSSQSMVKKGDATAQALFEEYMKIPMPDQNFTDGEIGQMLQYINSQGGNQDSGETLTTEKSDITQLIGNSASGRDLFIGKKSFENGGISCISCHTLNDEAAYYAGSLAKDLTKSYTTMQRAGIESVLQFLSFPAMSDSYKNNPFTDTEIADLSAYMQEVSEKQPGKKVANFGFRFLLYGFIFFIILIAFFEVFWKNKKPNSVKEHLLR